MHIGRICTLGIAGSLALLAARPVLAHDSAKPGAPKVFELTTKSQEAKDGVRELQRRIESFQFGPQNAELARKIIAADPAFALGVYYLSAVTQPPENQKHLEAAVGLAKNASDGERRFIEAAVLVRGKTPADGIPPLTQLVRDYPDERFLHMVLGQALQGDGKLAEARAEYRKAIAIDGSTPRAHSLIGNLLVLEGDYAGARQAYQDVLEMMKPGTAPGPVRYGVAFTYLYEGKPDAALESLRTFIDEYRNAGAPFGIPEVFIWNSIARINLESGRLEEALAAYEKGYESVPGSGLEATDKAIWLGRLHHGKGRTLARMRRFDEAMKEVETIRQMIDQGGERGKQFEPAFHYLVGYIKLEQGDVPAAIEHLKQTTDDPFHKLLLARAYEKAGDKENAKKTYEWVVNYSQNTIERALSYAEAKKKLATL